MFSIISDHIKEGFNYSLINSSLSFYYNSKCKELKIFKEYEYIIINNKEHYLEQIIKDGKHELKVFYFDTFNIISITQYGKENPLYFTEDGFYG